jgi:hypothetical protein
LEKPPGYYPAAAEFFTAAGNMHPFSAFTLGLGVDAIFRGTGTSQPPAIILDYMYGVAAYNCWGSTAQGIHDVVENY